MPRSTWGSSSTTSTRSALMRAAWETGREGQVEHDAGAGDRPARGAARRPGPRPGRGSSARPMPVPPVRGPATNGSKARSASAAVHARAGVGDGQLERGRPRRGPPSGSAARPWRAALCSRLTRMRSHSTGRRAPAAGRPARRSRRPGRPAAARPRRPRPAAISAGAHQSRRAVSAPASSRERSSRLATSRSRRSVSPVIADSQLGGAGSRGVLGQRVGGGADGGERGPELVRDAAQQRGLELVAAPQALGLEGRLEQAPALDGHRGEPRDRRGMPGRDHAGSASGRAGPTSISPSGRPPATSGTVKPRADGVTRDARPAASASGSRTRATPSTPRARAAARSTAGPGGPGPICSRTT